MMPLSTVVLACMGLAISANASAHAGYYLKSNSANPEVKHEQQHQPDQQLQHPHQHWQRFKDFMHLHEGLLKPIDSVLTLFSDSVSHRYHRPAYPGRKYHGRGDGYVCRVNVEGYGHTGRTDGRGHCEVDVQGQLIAFERYKILHR